MRFPVIMFSLLSIYFACTNELRMILSMKNDSILIIITLTCTYPVSILLAPICEARFFWRIKRRNWLYCYRIIAFQLLVAGVDGCTRSRREGGSGWDLRTLVGKDAEG